MKGTSGESDGIGCTRLGQSAEFYLLNELLVGYNSPRKYGTAPLMSQYTLLTDVVPDVAEHESTAEVAYGQIGPFCDGERAQVADAWKFCIVKVTSPLPQPEGGGGGSTRVWRGKHRRMQGGVRGDAASESPCDPRRMV